MITTLREAKKKRCGHNLQYTCYGDECMMWEWHSRKRLVNSEVSGQEPEHWEDIPYWEQLGCCGLTTRGNL